MQIRPLKIEGAFEVTPRQFPDDRGLFLESFRGDRLAKAVGHRMNIIQTNVSVSSRGTIRGVHFADVPPSQAKYVTAMTGSFIDFVIDIRVGSPTFGRWDSVLLDTVDRRAIYLAEGLGHVICCLEDDATVMYLCSTTYDPLREHAVIGYLLHHGIKTLRGRLVDAPASLRTCSAQGDHVHVDQS